MGKEYLDYINIENADTRTKELLNKIDNSDIDLVTLITDIKERLDDSGYYDISELIPAEHPNYQDCKELEKIAQDELERLDELELENKKYIQIKIFPITKDESLNYEYTEMIDYNNKFVFLYDENWQQIDKNIETIWNEDLEGELPMKFYESIYNEETKIINIIKTDFDEFDSKIDYIEKIAYTYIEEDEE